MCIYNAYLSAYSVYVKYIILAIYNYQFSIVTNLGRASISSTTVLNFNLK